MLSNNKTTNYPIYSCKKAALKIVNNFISASYENSLFFPLFGNWINDLKRKFKITRS